MRVPLKVLFTIGGPEKGPCFGELPRLGPRDILERSLGRLGRCVSSHSRLRDPMLYSSGLNSKGKLDTTAQPSNERILQNLCTALNLKKLCTHRQPSSH